MSAVQTVVCIGENNPRFDAMISAAQVAGASVPERLGWGPFAASPICFAHPQSWAYAYVDAGMVDLDIRLGQLCRSFPYGVVLQLAEDVGASDQQLFAHGFQKFSGLDEIMTPQVGEQNAPSPAERCFRFRLQDYKIVPDWLNARFWAHPERFHL